MQLVLPDKTKLEPWLRASHQEAWQHQWMDWFKGKSTGNHRFSHYIWGFPVTFPLNQFSEWMSMDTFEHSWRFPRFPRINCWGFRYLALPGSWWRWTSGWMSDLSIACLERLSGHGYGRCTPTPGFQLSHEKLQRFLVETHQGRGSTATRLFKSQKLGLRKGQKRCSFQSLGSWWKLCRVVLKWPGHTAETCIAGRWDTAAGH